MNESNIHDYPADYARITRKSEDIGFTMPSDVYIGSLLKTLVSSKPGGRFLELGTGIGLSLSWMIDGMDAESHLISVDNDPKLIAIATEYFGKDERVALHCADGSNWIKTYTGDTFDLVFADAWPGKYSETDEILDQIKDYTLRWPSKLTYPRLLLTPDDVVRFKQRVDPIVLAKHRKTVDYLLANPGQLNIYRLDEAIPAYLATDNARFGKLLVETATSMLQESVDALIDQNGMPYGAAPHQQHKLGWRWCCGHRHGFVAHHC